METRGKPFAPWVWIPLALTLGGAACFAVGAFSRRLEDIGLTGGGFYVAGLIYFLVQLVGRLFLKQWKAALFAVGRLVFCLLVLIPVGVMTFVAGFIGESEDGFAKGLTIPTNIVVAVPLPEPECKPGVEDLFQKTLIDALNGIPHGDASITPSLPSLRALARDNRPLLLRHLASSAAWRVFEEHGSLFATRRWQVGGMWLWNLHGYYTTSEIDRWHSNINQYFQSRTTIGLDGKPWWKGSTQLEEGIAAKRLSLSKGNQVDESDVVIKLDNIVVELFEQSNGQERRLTKAALQMLEQEFKALRDRNEFDRSLLPPGSIQRGQPVLNLYNGMQPGIYEVEARVNPGEPGKVYLKAYEVTRAYRLSESGLGESSNERIGWSDDADELFLYNSNITICEGDWGQPYAARFELWFVPDSGKPERKLLERVFKIEGWQR